jgi:hypothetical protein
MVSLRFGRRGEGRGGGVVLIFLKRIPLEGFKVYVGQGGGHEARDNIIFVYFKVLLPCWRGELQ